MDELYAFWLQLACGICNHIYLTLFTRFSSFQEIYECEDFSFLSGNYSCVKSLRDKNLDEAYELQKRCRSMHLHVIPYYDERYPDRLRLIYAPPAILYAIGDLRDLNQMVGVGVVGTRSATDYGAAVAEDFAYYLTIGGATVISGLAKGIDTCAHRGAIRAKGYTVAVLGTPIDVIYPKENAKAFQTLYQRGLVVSEMYPGCKRTRGDFPNRNRIISALSEAVLVAEAGERSGALITARHAISQNRLLYAIPGSLTDAHAGTNQLIKRGVRVATTAKDILDDLALTHPTKIHPEYLFSKPHIYAYGNQSPYRKPASEDPLFDDTALPEPVFEPKQQKTEQVRTEQSPEQNETPDAETNTEKILRALRERPLTADELTAATGIGVAELLADLTVLEITGNVQSAPGNRFTRIK